MNRPPFFNPLNSATTVGACHQDHQHLKQIIERQEEEIAQLRSLLLDVMNQHNCHSLRHSAIDYYTDLNHLQFKLDRLQRDFVCERTECAAARGGVACADAHFGLSATIDRHASALVSEFARIKDGCLQFLSGMMSLNIL